MLDAAASGAFRRHLVDPRAPRALDDIGALLRETGLVTVEGLRSRTEVLSFAKRVMDLVEHRDSDSDRLTTIRHVEGRGHRDGYAGFGTRELALHTERSGVPTPPRLMMLVCGTVADSGGESLLADGRAVHAALSNASPDAVEVLSQPRTAFFGNGDGHATQVFTRHHDGRVSIRLRTDALARWNPLALPHLPLLQAALAEHQVVLPLEPGQGYLIDNTRWLHARRAFTGGRLCWRALGAPRSRLPSGFQPAIVSTAAHPRVLEAR
ncbi:TauD/TfdA family dioxygenase [Streptomyces sp. RY43-2]|uniref:TauD/TfdA family dioxygenase n=1 Tax=Streptomyces macrolidinus TaxID=2952607 RepID=A0ABT0ZAD9_9ACTN|nr:TauD/TfdA family dioxygenase [Streptomyces macrolidinus]MCN9240724.1 TauD/TfdA family dioxygenase [Streptomyces macrolidinus]